MARAQRIARAGPSKTQRSRRRRCRSPRPRDGRASSTAAWCCSTRCDQAESPTRRAVSVEPTMSVKRIVARTRSATGAGRAPVKNSSTSSSSCSASTHGSVHEPGSSIKRAPGMTFASSGSICIRCIGSSLRRRTSVGACTLGRASWTSPIATVARWLRIAPGLPPTRSRAPHHAFITSSASGANLKIVSPSPQRSTMPSMIAARCSSGTSMLGGVANVLARTRARVRSG